MSNCDRLTGDVHYSNQKIRPTSIDFYSLPHKHCVLWMLIFSAGVETARWHYEFCVPTMLTLYQFKPTFQTWLRPLVQGLAKARVRPNHITLTAIALSMGVGIGIALFPQKFLLLLPITLLVRMALNAIDGMLAREHNLITPLGGILNELGDCVSDAALYLPFSLIPGMSEPWIALVVVGALLTEFAGVLGAQRSYAGPMGKSDRALVFSLIALVLGVGIQPAPWFNAIWIAVVLLEIVTIVNRIRAALEVKP